MGTTLQPQTTRSIAPHPGGRPTKYNETMLASAKAYFESCWSENPRTPFIEELSLILGVDDDTIVEWANKKDLNDELLFEEYSATIKKIKTLQKLRLLQRCLTRYNPTGAIFLLKTVYGMMEEEKRLLARKSNQPLVIEIVEGKRTSQP